MQRVRQMARPEGRLCPALLGQLERNATLAVQLQGKFAVHGVERGLLLFVLQGDVVQSPAIQPVGRGGANRMVSKSDEVDGRSSAADGRRLHLLPILIVLPKPIL